MKAEEIRNLNWVKLESTEEYKDWKSLPKREWAGKQYVVENLIDLYLEEVYKQIARKLNISFKELSSIIKEENSVFYTLRKELFKNNYRLDVFDGGWKLVKSYFMIPDVNSVPMIPKLDDKPDNPKLIEYISFFTYEERKQLAESLKEFEDNNKKFSSEKLLEDFKKLSDLEKFQVLNSLKLLQVKIEFPTN